MTNSLSKSYTWVWLWHSINPCVISIRFINNHLPLTRTKLRSENSIISILRAELTVMIYINPRFRKVNTLVFRRWNILINGWENLGIFISWYSLMNKILQMFNVNYIDIYLLMKWKFQCQCLINHRKNLNSMKHPTIVVQLFCDH